MNCWAYAILDCLHLLEHGTEGSVDALANNPTPRDLERARRLRLQMVAFLLSNAGAATRQRAGIELPLHTAAVRRILQDAQWSTHGICSRVGHYRFTGNLQFGSVYLEAAACVLGVDIYARCPPPTAPAVCLHDTYTHRIITATGRERTVARTLSEQAVWERLRTPHTVPVVVLEYNGHNHFGARRLETAPPYTPPAWLVVE